LESLNVVDCLGGYIIFIIEDGESYTWQITASSKLWCTFVGELTSLTASPEWHTEQTTKNTLKAL
jgi:hypothetical protein